MRQRPMPSVSAGASAAAAEGAGTGRCRCRCRCVRGCIDRHWLSRPFRLWCSLTRLLRRGRKGLARRRRVPFDRCSRSERCAKVGAVLGGVVDGKEHSRGIVCARLSRRPVEAYLTASPARLVGSVRRCAQQFGPLVEAQRRAVGLVAAGRRLLRIASTVQPDQTAPRTWIGLGEGAPKLRGCRPGALGSRRSIRRAVRARGSLAARCHVLAALVQQPGFRRRRRRVHASTAGAVGLLESRSDRRCPSRLIGSFRRLLSAGVPPAFRPSNSGAASRAPARRSFLRRAGSALRCRAEGWCRIRPATSRPAAQSCAPRSLR